MSDDGDDDYHNQGAYKQHLKVVLIHQGKRDQLDLDPNKQRGCFGHCR